MTIKMKKVGKNAEAKMTIKMKKVGKNAVIMHF